MAADGDGRERVNVFHLGERYLFKHYFEGEEVFDRLKRYYDNSQYRFEVPEGQFPVLRAFLADRGYDLEVVDDPAEYAVVVRKYTAHPDNIFKDSVLQRSVDGYNCFLLTDGEAVERAVEEGAVPLSVTDLERPF